MPLRVVTGRANAGKTGRMLAWALEALDAGSSPTLVVPHLADVRRLQSELSEKAPLGVRVSTAESFTEELWQLHGDGRRLVEDATRSAVIRRILAEPSLGDSGPSAQTPGFERLMLRVARWSQADREFGLPAESGPVPLVILLLQRYREALADLGLVERAWVGGLLRGGVPEIGFLGALRFTTFSAAHVDLLTSLSERNTVCVALLWEEGFGPTTANDAAAAAFLERAEIVEEIAEPPATSELEWLAGRLGEGSGPLRPEGQVVLGEARGGEGEAALVARLARRAIEGGSPPERVAIVFPRLSHRTGPVRNALSAEGLEGDFDSQIAVSATSFGRTLTALLRLGLGRGARADALEFLQGSFSDADPAAVLALDRTWRSARHGENSREVLRSMIGLGGFAQRTVENCRDLANTPVARASAEKWQELADNLISTAELHATAGLSREDASAHRAVTAAVAQMASAPGGQFGAADILEALPRLTCARPMEESPGRVQVIQAARVGARRFDAVIVGGLTQSEAPGGSRETFASEIGALTSGRARSDEDAVANIEFYSLITRARSLLALVRQTHNSDGVPQTASPFLGDVLDVYRDPRITVEPIGAECPLEVVRASDVLTIAPVFTRGRREERTRPDHLVPQSRVVAHGSVDRELATAAVSGRALSPTEVETYLACPYRWFYSRVLRPVEVDRELDAAALGSRAHSLIAQFYKALSDEGSDRVTPGSLPAALELFERTAEQAEGRMAPPLSLGEEIDVGRARLWARHVVEDDACLLPEHVPFGHEIDFGRETAFEFAGVQMAGRIDRIDAGPEGLVVTDYKSARDVGKLVRPGDGFGIQHVVYAVAAEHLLDRPVQAAVYRSLRSRQMRGYWRSGLAGGLPDGACEKDAVDQLQYEAIVAFAEERVAAAVEGMRSGRVPRAPRAQAECRFCALGAICEGART